MTIIAHVSNNKFNKIQQNLPCKVGGCTLQDSIVVFIHVKKLTILASVLLELQSEQQMSKD